MSNDNIPSVALPVQNLAFSHCVVPPSHQLRPTPALAVARFGTFSLSVPQRASSIQCLSLSSAPLGKVQRCRLMNVERYSQVMHISSTVTGGLDDKYTCWDALQSALPVGTVSGAPKVKIMELIDRLEMTHRGPYSGGLGGISFLGDMDIVLTLRTIIFPMGIRFDTMFFYKDATTKRREWIAYLQAGAGIVADSNPDNKQKECENKVAGIARAIDSAESAFVNKSTKVWKGRGSR